MRELFELQVEVERLHPGAALAVYHRGRLVVDLVARTGRHSARSARDHGYAVRLALGR